MINGIIIYNESVRHNSKFMDHVDWFTKEGILQNTKIKKLSNAELVLIPLNFLKEVDFAIVFDKDITLIKYLENKGIKCFNSSESVSLCDDKSLTQIILEKNNIPTPKTMIMPKTFQNLKLEELSFVDSMLNDYKYPIVIKKGVGSFGENVYLAKDLSDLKSFIVKIGTTNSIIIQEFIEESKGKDIRMYIVGGKHIGSCIRINDKDFRSNATLGGKMHKYLPTDEEVKIGLTASKALGLDFCGIDILFGKNGPLICEVNSNAHMKFFYECTGINIPIEIIKYIKNSVL